MPFLFYCQVLDFFQVVLYNRLIGFPGLPSLSLTSIEVCHSEMGEAVGVFNLKAEFIPLGTILGIDESHSEVVSDDSKNWGTNRHEVVMALSIDIFFKYLQKNKPDLSLSNVWI